MPQILIFPRHIILQRILFLGKWQTLLLAMRKQSQRRGKQRNCLRLGKQQRTPLLLVKIRRKRREEKKKADEGDTATPTNRNDHVEQEGEEVVTKEKRKRRNIELRMPGHRTGDENVDAGKKKKRMHAEQEEESGAPS